MTLTRILVLLALCCAPIGCGDDSSGGNGGDGDGDGSGGGSGDGDGDGDGSGGSSGDGDGDGGGDGDGDGDGPLPGDLSQATVAQVPAIIAAATCQGLLDCMGPVVLAGILDHEDCETALTAGLRDGDYAYYEQSVTDGRTNFDASQLQACHDALVALGCELQTAALPDACQAAVGGTVADGDACVATIDCDQRSYCKNTDACPSTCARRKAAGASCDSSDECNADLFCIGGACGSPLQDLGESCENADEVCRYGNACVANAGGDAVCGVPSFDLDVGASCDLARGKYCKEGNACVVVDQGTDTTECQPQVGPGDDCLPGSPSQCPVGHFCEFASGTCQPQGAAGEDCVGNPNNPNQCTPGNVCVSGTCEPIGRIGDDCAAGGQCRSGNCPDGKCAAPVRCD